MWNRPSSTERKLGHSLKTYSWEQKYNKGEKTKPRIPEPRRPVNHINTFTAYFIYLQKWLINRLCAVLLHIKEVVLVVA